MSRPIQPAGTSTPSSSRRWASAAKRSAITRSLGSSKRARAPPAATCASACLAWATSAASHSDSPTAWPWAREEGEAHRAADHHRVGDPQEAVDHGDLVGHLGAADDRHQRAGGVLEHGAQRAHLAFEQPPGGVRQQVGDALGARVRAVGDAEGVVDVDVRELRQSMRELGVVACLARLEADVLEQQDLAVAQRLGERPRLWTRPRRGRASPRSRVSSRRRSATGAIDSPATRRPSGRSRWRDQHQARAPRAQLFDRGQRRADAGVVGDLDLPVGADGEGHVEVHAHQHAPPANVEVVEAPHRTACDRASIHPTTVARPARPPVCAGARLGHLTIPPRTLCTRSTRRLE